MHFKIFKMIATRGFQTAVECTKSVFGRGSAPNSAGGAHDAPPDPLVGWGGDTPPHSPPPRRLRRLGLVACGDSSSAPSAPRSQNILRNFFLDTALTTTTTAASGRYCWDVCYVYVAQTDPSALQCTARADSVHEDSQSSDVAVGH